MEIKLHTIPFSLIALILLSLTFVHCDQVPVPDGIPPEVAKLYNRGLENWKPPEEFSGKFPYYLSGYDEDGNPVWVLEFGKWDIHSVVEQGPEATADLDKYIDQTVLTMYNSTVIKGGGVAPLVGIMDMDGYSLKQLASPRTLEFIVLKLRLIVIALSNLQSASIINTSFVAERFLRLIKPFLGAEFEKLEIYGTNPATWKAKLLKKIPRDQLPSWYGGTEDFKPIKVYG